MSSYPPQAAHLHTLTSQTSAFSSKAKPAPPTMANAATPRRTAPLRAAVDFWGETTMSLIHVHPHSKDAAQAEGFHPKYMELGSPAPRVTHPSPSSPGAPSRRLSPGNIWEDSTPPPNPGAHWQGQGGRGPSGGRRRAGELQADASLTSNACVVGNAHDAVRVVRRCCHLPCAASAVPARRNPP